MNFEEYKKTKEGIEQKELLSAILSDMGCTFPLFEGIIDNANKDRPDLLYIIRVHEIGKKDFISYPFEDAPLFSILLSISQKQDYHIGDKVIFSMAFGSFDRDTDLLRASKIKKREDVEAQLGHINSFDLINLARLIELFSPFRIARLEKTLQDFNDIDNIVTGLDEGIREINNHLDTLSDLQELARSSEKISDKVQDAREIKSVLQMMESMPSLEKVEERQNKLSELISGIENAEARFEHVNQLFSCVYPSEEKNLPKVSVDDPSKISIPDIQSRMKFGYSEKRVLSFLMALNTSQIIILHGKPGTGKSMFAEQIAYAIGADYEAIEVQNNWTDSSDILGYYNPMHKRYQSTRFLAALKRAEADPERIHIICLEEMNLARAEYYFATFLNLLQKEPFERKLFLLPDDVERDVRCLIKADKKTETYKAETLDHLKNYLCFTLPSNIRFVATINDDSYTNTLSPKVIDRSFFIGFDTREKDEGDDITPIPTTEYYKTSCFDQHKSDAIEAEAQKALGKLWNPKAFRRNRYICEMYAFIKSVSKEDMFFEIIKDELKSRNSIEHPKMED